MTALDDNLQAIAARFEEGIDELALTIVKRQREDIAEFEVLESPEISELMGAITRESRLAQAPHLTRGRQIPTTCPPADAKAARIAARSGVSIVSVLEAYRIGHDESWQAWLEAIEQVEMDQSSRRVCRQTISRFVMRYDQAVAARVTEEYERERRVAMRLDDRMNLIRELVDGSRDDCDGLDYDLDLEHLGVVGWGARVRPALSELAGQLDRRLLSGDIEDGLTMAWLGGRTPLQPADLKGLRAYQPPKRTQLAIGNPAYGLKGFRRTHRQAGDARLVAGCRPKPVTLFSDVHLEAFALRDESLAREFVATELDGLGGDDEDACRSRDTLRAYFGASQNVRATASSLEVHEHTVSRRLRAIEAHIGQPVNRRRAELELALRLDSLLNHSAS